MWGLRTTLVRAAGVAALALGFQALRWLTGKKGTEEDETLFISPVRDQKVREVELSPIRRSSEESSQEEHVEPASEPQQESVSESQEESVSEPQEEESREAKPRQPEKILRFQEPETSESELGSRREIASSAAESETESDYGSSPSSSHSSREGWQELADGQAVIHTPQHQKSQQADKPLYAPELSFPQIDYEPEKSPFDLSSPRRPPSSSNGHAAEDERLSGRHSRHPSFPIVDYEPGQACISESSQAGSLDMAPAPTEEGDSIAKVEEALAELEEQAVRRHSRSFSEPNLAAKLQQRLLRQRQAAQLDGHSRPHHNDNDEDAESPSLALRPTPDGWGDRDGLDGSVSNDASPSASLAQQTSAKRAREESEAPPLLRLEVLSGPSSSREITIDDPSQQVLVGRNTDNTLAVEDNEVSGSHAELRWDPRSRCWQVRDTGSLNGTQLNGNFISNKVRKPGRLYRLTTDDILLLGSRTAIKVIYLPNAGMPDMPQNLKRVFAPPSSLQPTITLRSETLSSLRDELGIEKAIQAAGLRLSGAVLCRVGMEHQRKGSPCEDVPFWGDPGRFQAALYCVFDGHCGRKTAMQCTQLLPEELRQRMPEVKPCLTSGEGPGKIWEDVFLSVDAALVDTEDGCTATAVLVWRDAAGDLCIQAANVGDSAAVFCKADADPRQQFSKLTVDHRISEPAEKTRLAGLGIDLGRNRNRLYGLNVSRCLGDKFIKANDLGFTAVPHVSEVARLSPHESGTLVIASDGLWDVAEPGRVMELAFEAQQQPGSSPASVAEAIYQHAMKQRSRDDVCVFVLTFSPEGGAC